MFRPKMLNGPYLRVWEAKTAEDLRREVVSFARGQGFDTASIMSVVDHSKTHSEFFGVDNTPIGYLEEFSNIDSARRDPVMQHCKYSSLPIVWDWTTYRSKGQMELWERQARFGLKVGISVAMHFPEGRHFCMGMDRDKPLRHAKQLTEIAANLQLFVVHAQESANRILVPTELESNEEIRLTPRELEALRWTIEGKTAVEVGEMINISTRTAVFHLRNAMLKLKCKSKHQAVLKAIQLGLLL